MSERKVYLECSCHSPDHLLVCSLDTDPRYDPELWFQPILNYRHPWYKRVWAGLKYVFKRSVPTYWHFDTLCVTDEKVNELAALIVHYRLVQKVRKRKLAEQGR